jgi:hypothetical protein
MIASFKISDICTEFMTRQSGKKLRERVIQSIDKGDFILIDLENQTLSPSFADDSFGKTVSTIGIIKFKKSIKIINTEPSSRSLIIHVVNSRAKELKEVPV